MKLATSKKHQIYPSSTHLKMYLSRKMKNYNKSNNNHKLWSQNKSIFSLIPVNIITITRNVDFIKDWIKPEK